MLALLRVAGRMGESEAAVNAALLEAEAWVAFMEDAANDAWIAWVRAAVARGVRCDVSLVEVPLVIDRGKTRTTTKVPSARRKR